MFSLVGSIGLHAAARLVLRPLTHSELADYSLPDGTQVSGGLTTIGIGQPAYLEIDADTNTAVSAVEWNLDSKPSGSLAALTASPLGDNIPIYEPSDQLVYSLVERKLLVPDKTGQYTVSAKVTEADGDETLSVTITAGTYVGAGVFGTPKAVWPQCALCHKDKVAEWMGTLHSSMFTRSIDGQTSSHYNSSCIECHTVGYDTAPAAQNGGFDDVAAALGWTFPDTLDPTNWDAVPDQLKQLANIQCENCHGPGSEHYGRADHITVDPDSGNCAQCHDEMPHHSHSYEWNQSLHAITTRHPSGPGEQACVGCHTGTGFIDRMEGVPESDRRTQYEPINCSACHDPHSDENPHQLRSVAPVTLMNGAVVNAGGNGRLCMNCHHARQDADTYTTAYHSHYGPHHGPQTDMLAGTNAVEYGQSIPSSGHLFATQDACVTCHMQTVASDNPALNHAGGHTFKVVWDAGTPSDPSDDVDMVGVCMQCHGPIKSFDFARADYNGDGIVEGVQTEVKGLLDQLGKLLPPLNDPTVTVSADYTPAQLKAAYNYLFVSEDGSMGVHNLSYTVGILKASIENLTGTTPSNDDTNHNGLPDSWEMQMFGNLNQTADGDYNGNGLTNLQEYKLGLNPTKLDTDGDGYNDTAELALGTDPTNPADNPGLAVHMYHAAEFRFSSQEGKTYQIQAAGDLNKGWQNIGDPIPGTGDLISRFVSTEADGYQFYRVVEVQ